MSQLINYTLHNHTYRCKHAIGSEKDMVLEALKHEFKYIGIADHMAYPTSYQSFRMNYEERFEYLDNLNQLKNEYNILRGFEAEYQEEFFNEIIDHLKNNRIDYYILGQHYVDLNREETYFGYHLDNELITKYVDLCIEGMRTGVYLYLAHPDLFLMNNHFDKHTKKESIRLIEASIKYDVYLEYNAGGLRQGLNTNQKRELYRYPKYDFWNLVKEYNGLVVIGSDAHMPQEINDEAFNLALKEVKELGLNLIEEIDFDRYFKRLEQYK